MFNFKLAKVRITIEQAFGRLKNRWPMLKELRSNRRHMMREVIEMCFILHNFLEIRDDEWENEADQIEPEDIAEGRNENTAERGNEDSAPVNDAFKRRQKIIGEAKRNSLMASLFQ
jgi:hypothetical protein